MITRLAVALLLGVCCSLALARGTGNGALKLHPAAPLLLPLRTTPASSLLASSTAAEDWRQNDSTPAVLHGRVVDDCCDCTYQAVDEINRKLVHPTLTELVKLAYFRYFKVNIHCDCPLWPDDGMCMLKACSVCICDPSEVPQPWLLAEQHDCPKRQPMLEQCDDVQCSAELTSAVDRNVEPQVQAKILNLKGWRGYNNPWMAEGDEDDGYEYINLLANPERYTGYAGDHPHRIWKAIYGQQVFAALDSREKVVFYRLISGMHASISAHLSANYLLDQVQDVWGPNLYEFQRRLGNSEVQDRVENLYFSYAFVLAAVVKAGPQLIAEQLSSGLPDEDQRAMQLLGALVHNSSNQTLCPRLFDEGRLWQQGETSQQLKQQLQQAFQHITKIADCIGCEKCKLWGKLQTLGIATALKILFSTSEAPDSIHLERNEVIALVNLLERFSSSIEYYRTLSKELQSNGGAVQPVNPFLQF